MNKKLAVFSFVLALVLGLSAVADLSLEEIIGKLQANQSKIKDMYVETLTTINSNMSAPGQENKGPQKMVQKSKMWTKGQDKAKIEMLSPNKQVTITNGDKMVIINPETGQKMVQDLAKMRAQGMSSGNQGMNLDKVKEFFDLNVKQIGGQYVITGVPKKANQALGKMEFYIDQEKWQTVKIMMYDAKGRLINQSDIGYQEIDDVWVPAKNKSVMLTPMGKMDVEMEMSNVKINQGIKDSEFRVE